jgi:hypothetical protein
LASQQLLAKHCPSQLGDGRTGIRLTADVRAHFDGVAYTKDDAAAEDWINVF